jgi:hypothetical protein
MWIRIQFFTFIWIHIELFTSMQIPDPAHQGDANLQPLAYRPYRPPFKASTPPFFAFEALHGSTVRLESS